MQALLHLAPCDVAGQPSPSHPPNSECPFPQTFDALAFVLENLGGLVLPACLLCGQSGPETPESSCSLSLAPSATDTSLFHLCRPS